MVKVKKIALVVYVNESLKNRISSLAKRERRSFSSMAGILLNDAMKNSPVQNRRKKD